MRRTVQLAGLLMWLMAGCAGPIRQNSDRAATQPADAPDAESRAVAWPGNPPQIVNAAGMVENAWQLKSDESHSDLLGGIWSASSSAGVVTMHVVRLDDVHSRVWFEGSLKSALCDYLAHAIHAQLLANNRELSAEGTLWPADVEHVIRAVQAATDDTGSTSVNVFYGDWLSQNQHTLIVVKRIDGSHSRVIIDRAESQEDGKKILKTVRAQLEKDLAAESLPTTMPAR